jgi:hypothetical protein
MDLGYCRYSCTRWLSIVEVDAQKFPRKTWTYVFLINFEEKVRVVCGQRQYVVSIGKIRYAYNILVGKSQMRIRLWRSRCRWDIIIMDLME